MLGPGSHNTGDEAMEEEGMEQQRFASLTGRARDLLPAEELDPDPAPEPRPSVRRAQFERVPVERAPLARVGDLLAHKSAKAQAR